MQELAAFAWTPWIAWLVVGVGGVLLLATVVGPVRALPRAIAALRGREVTEGTNGPLWLPLAAATGMGGITGGVIAVTTGGPGALVWMWIATLLGMAIVFAEASLSARSPEDHEPAAVHILSAPGGRLLAPMYAVAVLVLAMVVGGAFQTHQAAAVLGVTHDLPPLPVAIGLAVVAAPFVLLPKLRKWLWLTVPVAIVLYVIIALGVITEGTMPLSLLLGDAVNQAFGVPSVAGGAVGGGVGLAVTHGVLRATLAGEAGLGSAALLDLRARGRGIAGAVAMLVPLIAAGVVGSTSALLMLEAAPADEPVTDPALPMPRPLEVIQGKGLRPSQQVGQTVVLHDDTTMQADEHYAMMLRSDPRGHAMGRLVDDKNHVALPHWAVAHASDTIVLHGRSDRRMHPGWDIRIPCEREVKQSPDGLEYLLLRPKDPELKIKTLAIKLELDTQPYVIFDDFSFPGRVGIATSPDLGEHLAMYEAPSADRPFNPKLHEFFRNGYRGPYADDEGPRPPWAFIAREGFDAEIGTKIPLRIVSDPRGEAVLHTTPSGSLEAPPWDILLDAKTVVLRHESEPSRDLLIPVTPRSDLHRVRFTVDDERFVDARGALRLPDHYEKDPYLIVPEYTFEAEVHGDARLPATIEVKAEDGTTQDVPVKGRRTLVPLHPLGEAQGPFGDTETYHPHPAELIAFGMRGPLLPAAEGAPIAAARLLPGGGSGRRVVLAFVVLVFALSTIVAWAELGGRAATAVVGSLGARVLPLAVLVTAAVGTSWTFEQLLPAVDLSLAAVVVPNLLGLLLLVPKINAAARMTKDLEPTAAPKAKSDPDPES
ncbi:alanine:cation symporter family protein [Paraliomyxa miuraensis]|uniref:alanine:cation symporter family protein n=1 Tax=Paraliomyxa miuraensis TaxID=376150 RepID=UPI002252DDFF|nr:alanine:cation symporter family protein [Paraliomyxa miuraensis]MCX4240245.1 alanine:cation symporter family protein [Paraliomyxa miuraensis]